VICAGGLPAQMLSALTDACPPVLTNLYRQVFISPTSTVIFAATKKMPPATVATSSSIRLPPGHQSCWLSLGCRFLPFFTGLASHTSRYAGCWSLPARPQVGRHPNSKHRRRHEDPELHDSIPVEHTQLTE
jgi:hypothetical protein